MLEKNLINILRNDGRYTLAAVNFLREGLDYCIKKYYPGNDGANPTHVTGYQLCIALRELALSRWGYMAPFVLRYWNINSTRDFGEIVYLLIDHEYMRRNDEDSIEDFDNIYDFSDAFEQQD
ncbi:MAG: hypothetical protein JXM68_09470 [Sedimentisphaerales bacterium]|nr:hypothetical protein [Sedimentisphaerales bacterium]